MYIQRVRLRNFRCIHESTIECPTPITLVHGANATGKTSLLEALYYAAYLRSFRTMHPAHMIAFGCEAFTINIDGTSPSEDPLYNEKWHLHVGCSAKKRLVKKNNHTITSYKELLTFYRVMHIIEDDMEIIKGGPKSRRTFMDQSLFLCDHAYASTMRTYKKILSQRNALLMRGKGDDSVWLKQMWEQARHIVSARKAWLRDLQHEVNTLLETFFPHVQVHVAYMGKCTLDATFDAFYDRYRTYIMPQEEEQKRVKWGPHLDDIQMYFHEKGARLYASRGQQKLLMILIKLASIRLVNAPILLLVDDMFADFDAATLQRVLDMLAHKSHQIIMTAPGLYPHMQEALKPYTHHTVSISE